VNISVIIPVLNERGALPVAIAALRACRRSADQMASSSVPSQISASQTSASKAAISEIIVSDGGSTDGTADWVRAQPDLVLVNSARGKGPQLNAGATLATGDVLLFLHADCALSQATLDALHSALCDAGAPGSPISTPKPLGGAFYLRFAESYPRALRLVSWGINLRARLRGSATGDQGIFVRRDVFQSIGGAPDWPLFEDVELVRRIKQAGKFVVLKTPLAVSGRRYIEHGVFRTALLIYSLRFAYWLGVPPQRLKEWFRDARTDQKSRD
jgi:rSAM/selenodomain-associated transferase 2